MKFLEDLQQDLAYSKMKLATLSPSHTHLAKDWEERIEKIEKAIKAEMEKLESKK